MNLIPANATHVGARSEQQDALGFSDIDEQAFVRHGGVLAVVADGMGGLENGAAASGLAVQTMINSYRAKTPEETIPDALRRSARAANDAVFELARGTDGIGNVGTTLVAAVIHDESLYWISAGDSRLYLVRGAELAQLSADHTLEHQLLRRMIKGDIDYDEVQQHPERDSVTSYLGMQEPPEMDCNPRPFSVTKGDRLILCSDGLYNILSSEEILANAGTLEVHEAADALIRETIAKKHPQQDNVTVAMLELENIAVRVPTTKRATATSSRQAVDRRTRLAVGLGALSVVAGIGAYMIFDGHEAPSSNDSGGQVPKVSSAAPDSPASAESAAATGSENLEEQGLSTASTTGTDAKAEAVTDLTASDDTLPPAQPPTRLAPAGTPNVTHHSDEIKKSGEIPVEDASPDHSKSAEESRSTDIGPSKPALDEALFSAFQDKNKAKGLAPGLEPEASGSVSEPKSESSSVQPSSAPEPIGLKNVGPEEPQAEAPARLNSSQQLE